MYTRLPNWLIDRMPELTAPAVKVLVLVARKTIGWNRESDVISLSQFAQGTGLTRPTIVKAIGELETAQLIRVERISQHGVSWNAYSIVDAESTLITSEVSATDVLVVNEFNQGSKNDLPEVVNEFNQGVVKEFNTQKKSNIKKGKKDSSTTRDPRIDAWQLQVYRELARYHVPIAWRDEIISTVTDEAVWAYVIRTWIGRGYRPNAIGGMLDWYMKGVPDVKRGQNSSRSRTNSGSVSPEDYINQHQQQHQQWPIDTV